VKSAAAVLALTLSLSTLATAAKADRWHYLIDQRLAEHARLIEQGRADGKLTRFEAMQLRAEQANIRRMFYRYKFDGHLSNVERDRLRRMQDAAADHIFELRGNLDRRPRFGLFWGSRA
jgi:hypothetical protein